MIFTCKCCLYSQDILDEEEFNNIDWERIAAVEEDKDIKAKDEEIFCNLCPSFYTTDVAPYSHDAVHDNWNTLGRPDAFSIGSCLLEEDKKKVNRIGKLGEALFSSLPLSEKKLISSTLRSIHYGDRNVSNLLQSWAERPLTPSIW